MFPHQSDVWFHLPIRARQAAHDHQHRVRRGRHARPDPGHDVKYDVTHERRQAQSKTSRTSLNTRNHD